MTAFIGFIRGINVGTAKAVSMADLAAVFEARGYAGVRTHLRSGNVVFSAPTPPTRSDATAVEHELRTRTGVDARVLLLAAGTVRQIAEANPLRTVADDDSRLVITFLGEGATAPDGDTREGVVAPAPDDLAPEQLVIAPEAVYQWCPLGISNSKVKTSWWKALGPYATARNQRTVEKVLALADALEAAEAS